MSCLWRRWPRGDGVGQANCVPAGCRGCGQNRAEERRTAGTGEHRGRADLRWRSAPGRAGRRSAWNRPGSPTRRWSNWTPTRARRCAATGVPSGRSSRTTWPTWTGAPSPALTCSPAACPARRSPSRASSSAMTTSGTCSRRRCGWSRRPGPRAVLLENVRGLAARRFDGYRTQVLRPAARPGLPDLVGRGARQRARGTAAAAAVRAGRDPAAVGGLVPLARAVGPAAAHRGRAAGRPDGRRVAGRARPAGRAGPAGSRRPSSAAARSTAARTWARPGPVRPGSCSA